MKADKSIYISRKAFIQSGVILLILMVFAGVSTLIVPAGRYTRMIVDGREIVVPGSFKFVDRPDYPIWRWFTAPLEVLGGPDSMTLIFVALFVLFVAVSFAILDRTGLVHTVIVSVVQRYRHQKYRLLNLISLLFMSLGATFGIFEEIIPLVPLLVALAYSLGWDALVGLGMSILAVNLGFSAALANPFTIGVAQEIASLPLFSGFLFRLPIFILLYLILVAFLNRYAREIDAKPEVSLIFGQDAGLRQLRTLEYGPHDSSPNLRRAGRGLLLFLLAIPVVLILSSVFTTLSDYVLPIVGVLFLLGGVLTGVLSGASIGEVLTYIWGGVLGILPALPLILMASSIKFIVEEGAILDTILHAASTLLESTPPSIAILMMLLVTLILEVFISAGSAKAFLVMPIMVPLADLIGVTRQATVLAYAFGDGFSNLAYPTNPVLLICLGLTVVSYPTWMRWTARIWVAVTLVAVLSLIIAVSINYGPY